nr:hypothetical protein [Tanacetum cinerariifolium]
MSGSEPDEMAPKSSRAVVVPKVNMHIYTSELTSTELKDAINEYCIPIDLHPRLPHSGMTINRTVVNKGDPIPKDQRPKRRVTPSLPVGDPIPALTPFQKNLEKPNPKIAAAREKKDQQSLTRAEAKRAEDTLSASPLNQAISKTVLNPATVPLRSLLKSKKSKDESVGNRYVLNWRLCNDLRVYTFRACKELVSHLATLAKDEFLGALSNVELNHDYVDLQNCNDAHFLELDHLRSSVRRSEQENEGLNNKLSLIESAHSGCGSWEKELADVMKDLERERDEWRVTASNQVEQIRALEKDLEPKTYQLETAEERIQVLEGISLGMYEEEIAGLLAETKDLDIKGSKSWETKHVSAPRPTAEVPGYTGEPADDTDLRLLPSHHEITEDTPFGTTT